jgi:hypothetical protein
MLTLSCNHEIIIIWCGFIGTSNFLRASILSISNQIIDNTDNSPTIQPFTHALLEQFYSYTKRKINKLSPQLLYNNHK